MSNKNTTIDLSVNSKSFTSNGLMCRREELFKALKKVYYEETGTNLPIYGVVRILMNKNKSLAALKAEGLLNIEKGYEEGS